MITHLSTPEEVEQFAIEENHVILYKCIQQYKRLSGVTWEQAMQAAAISQAISLSEKAKQIIDILELSGRPLIIKPGG